MLRQKSAARCIPKLNPYHANRIVRTGRELPLRNAHPDTEKNEDFGEVWQRNCQGFL